MTKYYIHINEFGCAARRVRGAKILCNPGIEYVEFVRFEDVEASLNFAQQLKDEILPLIKDALEEFSDRKFNQGKYLLDKAMAKLSSV